MSIPEIAFATSDTQLFINEELVVKSFFEPMADLPIALVAFNKDGLVRFINAMAGYLLEIPTSLALDKPIESIIPNSGISDILNKGLIIHDRQEFINGHFLRCSSFPVQVGEKIMFGVKVMQDVTEKIALETELSKLRDKYKMLDMLLDESFEELGAVDKFGRLFYLTRKSAMNLGIDRKEALGRDITDLNPKCLLKKVASTGITEFAEISRRNKKSVPVVVMPLIKDEVVKGAVCRSLFADVQEAKSFVSKIENFAKINRSTESPKKARGCRFTFDDIVGTSKAILLAKKRAIQAAKGHSNILITGESGTGKELFAQAIHMASLRRHGPFVAINCAGIPENLLESELFGYESGSFTGARRGGKPGKFELSQNGTIFLDEAADMSMGMQAKLLRVIQERELVRVGGTQLYEIDVRIIAASNKDLWELVQRGQFREDLYYRLDVVNVQIPALRDRKEDIPVLTQFFISSMKGRIDSEVTGANKQVLDLFMKYSWPGNVRELRNVIEGAMNLNTGELINEASLPFRVKEKMKAWQEESCASNVPIFVVEHRAANEKALIEQAIRACNYNKRQAAIMLKICRATLYNKLKKYGL